MATEKNYSRPIILDVPFEKAAIEEALRTLRYHSQGHFWVVLVGSKTGPKIEGPAIGLDVKKESGVIIRVPVPSLVPDQPGGDAMAQGSFNRGLQAFLVGEPVIKEIALKIGLTLEDSATVVAVGEENGTRTLSYTVIGLGVQNGHDDEVIPVFTYNTGERIDIVILEDIVFVTMVERKQDGKLKYWFTRGMGIDLPPWALEFLRQGVEAGKIALLKDPRGDHNTSVLVSSTDEELARLAREVLISQAWLKILGMRKQGGFYENPTSEERTTLLEIVERLKFK